MVPRERCQDLRPDTTRSACCERPAPPRACAPIGVRFLAAVCQLPGKVEGMPVVVENRHQVMRVIEMGWVLEFVVAPDHASRDIFKTVGHAGAVERFLIDRSAANGGARPRTRHARHRSGATRHVAFRGKGIAVQSVRPWHHDGAFPALDLRPQGWLPSFLSRPRKHTTPSRAFSDCPRL